MNKFKVGDKVAVVKKTLESYGWVGTVRHSSWYRPQVEVMFSDGTVRFYNPNSRNRAVTLPSNGQALLGELVEFIEPHGMRRPLDKYGTVVDYDSNAVKVRMSDSDIEVWKGFHQVQLIDFSTGGGFGEKEKALSGYRESPAEEDKPCPFSFWIFSGEDFENVINDGSELSNAFLDWSADKAFDICMKNYLADVDEYGICTKENLEGIICDSIDSSPLDVFVIGIHGITPFLAKIPRKMESIGLE